MAVRWLFVITLVVASLLQASAAGISASVMAEFLSWLEDNGALLGPLRVEQAVDVHGNAHDDDPKYVLVAKQDIHNGDLLMAIPYNCTAQVLNLAGTPLEPLLLSYSFQGDSSDHASALHIMFERSRGRSSHFYPFLQTLPEVPSNPLFWTQQELDSLDAGTDFLLSTIDSDASRRNEEFALLDIKLKDVWPAVRSGSPELGAWPPSWWNIDEFSWALAIVRTRAWGLLLPVHPRLVAGPWEQYAAERVVVPYLDLLNHKPCHNAPLHTWDATGRTHKGKLALYHSGDTVSTGDQVWECYGAQDSFVLFKTFGFAVDGCTPEDEVALSPPAPRGQVGIAWLVLKPYGDLSDTILQAGRIAHEAMLRSGGISPSDGYTTGDAAIDAKIGSLEFIRQWITDEMQYYGTGFNSDADNLGLHLWGSLADHWQRVRRCHFSILERNLALATTLDKSLRDNGK